MFLAISSKIAAFSRCARRLGSKLGTTTPVNVKSLFGRCLWCCRCIQFAISGCAIRQFLFALCRFLGLLFPVCSRLLFLIALALGVIGGALGFFCRDIGAACLAFEVADLRV